MAIDYFKPASFDMQPDKPPVTPARNKCNTYVFPVLKETDFIPYLEEKTRFTNIIYKLRLCGISTERSALTALETAMRTDWSDPRAVRSKKYVIVMITNTKREEDPHIAESDEQLIAENAVSELSKLWTKEFCDRQQRAAISRKRLIIYAPDIGAWKHISDDWQNVIHYTQECVRQVKMLAKGPQKG